MLDNIACKAVRHAGAIRDALPLVLNTTCSRQLTWVWAMTVAGQDDGWDRGVHGAAGSVLKHRPPGVAAVGGSGKNIGVPPGASAPGWRGVAAGAACSDS